MSTSSLTFDTLFLFSSQTDSSAITPQTVEQTQGSITEAITKVELQIAEKKYGFIEELSHTEYITETKNVFEKIRWAKTLVVIGIGGSDLGLNLKSHRWKLFFMVTPQIQ